jgi:methionyl-tRNA formyltransferase
MRIVVLCATRRGYLFLQKLMELAPEVDLVVFSFREEPWEPRFLDDIRNLSMVGGSEFFETKQVGSKRLESFWEATPIDLMFVVSWRYMIPERVYSRPKLGTFVFHDSLLPEYRGFAPTVWAILNGEKFTGATLFEIAEEVDEGEIVSQKRVPISPDDTIADVMDYVTQAYLDLLAENLESLSNGTAPRYQQDHSRATYTCKRIPQDNLIDWSASTEQIYNLIRAATYPYPGAYTYLDGKRLTIWSAERLGNWRSYVGRVPGRVVDIRPGEGSVVLTGDGCLLIKQAQIEGENIVSGDAILSNPSLTLQS